MKHSSVSAVIRTYNRPQLFRECFDSVVKQTKQPDEIIIVDDSEHDYVSEVREEYGDELPDIKHLRNNDHVGQGDVLNTGLEAVSGDYIFIIDDDDKVHAELIEKELHKISKEKLDFCTAEHQFIDLDGVDCGVRDISLGESPLCTLLLKNELWTPSGILFKKEIIEKIGYFDEEMSLGEDWDFFIRVAREYKIGVIDEPLIDYRIHDSQITAESHVKETKQLLSTINTRYGTDAKSEGFRFYREFKSNQHIWIAGDYDKTPLQLLLVAYHVFVCLLWFPERLIHIALNTNK